MRSPSASYSASRTGRTITAGSVECRHGRQDHANADGSLNVSDEPIIPFIEGDGTGVDIWPAAKLVLDAAAEEARQHDRVERGARRREGVRRDGRLASRGDGRHVPRVPHRHQGPAHHADRRRLPSLNVALRQILDLYVCLRPVRWFAGVPSPVKHPEQVDMVIFRENTEDIYAGLEVEAGTPRPRR